MDTNPTSATQDVAAARGVLRCGVIGVGRMGRHHARVYSQGAGTELVGVVDRDRDRAREITESWGGAAMVYLDRTYIG